MFTDIVSSSKHMHVHTREYASFTCVLLYVVKWWLTVNKWVLNLNLSLNSHGWVHIYIFSFLNKINTLYPMWRNLHTNFSRLEVEWKPDVSHTMWDKYCIFHGYCWLLCLYHRCYYTLTPTLWNIQVIHQAPQNAASELKYSKNTSVLQERQSFQQSAGAEIYETKGWV